MTVRRDHTDPSSAQNSGLQAPHVSAPYDQTPNCFNRYLCEWEITASGSPAQKRVGVQLIAAPHQESDSPDEHVQRQARVPALRPACSETHPTM